MKRIVRLLLSGQSLRHRPVALRTDAPPPVRVTLRGGAGDEDVTGVVVPLSLRPFLFGIYLAGRRPPPVDVGSRCDLEFHDRASGTLIGRVTAEAAGVLPGADGDVLQMRPVRSAIRCVPMADRAWRNLLAWRQVQVNAKAPHHFQMSFSDLRALNVFYVLPRPVYLVSTVHGERSNIFPMDLVGPVGSGTFLLALRRTSPSIELMRESGRIVFSSVPASHKAVAYELGAHHKSLAMDWDRLPFAVEPSPVFRIPAPAFALRVRELEVRRATEIGSHVFFETRIVGDARKSEGAQLCHVSDMYARWRAGQGQPFEAA